MNKIVHNSAPIEQVIHYFPDGSAMILQNNIISPNRMVYPDSLYILKAEGFYTVVKVLKIWDSNGYVYLRVQDQGCSGRVYTIGQELDQQSMWYLYELDAIFGVLEDRIMMGLVVGKTTTDNELLEFDF